MRDHRKLEAFHLADTLVLDVYRATRTFPDDERYVLVAQIRRAAVSIAANIVEGSARASRAEYVRFPTIAFSSAREMQYELSVAHRLGYMRGLEYKSIHALSDRTCGALHGLIKALR